jgi:adenine-specific DNA-methyltransferase
VKALVQVGSSNDDIIMDFFSGSATTAHAVLDANLEDGTTRRFVMVQIDEMTEEDSPARQFGFHTIAEISKSRIRRVIERIQETISPSDKKVSPQLALDLDGADDDAQPTAPQDLGFKAFKLAPSTFRRWEPPEDAEELEQQLSYFDRGLKDQVDPTHAIYEILLKEGYSLNSAIEPLSLGPNTVYAITDEPPAPSQDLKGLSPQQTTPKAQPRPLRSGDDVTAPVEPTPPPTFYLCLDDDLDETAVAALPLDPETVFICQDTALDDSLKVNLSLQCVLKTI